MGVVTLDEQIVSGRPELIRRINRTLILDLLRREGALSRSDIAVKSGISLPAVSRTVAELIGDGWVNEIGIGTSSGGRRPILLQFNPRAGFIISLDVTPYRILGGAADLAGELIVTKAEVPRAMGVPLLDQVAETIAWLKEAEGVSRGPLVGIGVSVPGIPDRAGANVSLAPALDWQDVPAGKVLRERFACPVVVQNDVDALLLGEQWRGAAAGVQHAVAVYVGAGVGAGALLDGRLYRGRDGAVGEIGHWLTDPNQEPRPIGFGHLETAISTVSLARKWAARVDWKAGSQSDIMTAMAKRSQAGDTVTRELVVETARVIGMVVVNLVAMLNPEIVILGGEIIRLESIVLPVISQMVADHAPYPALVVPAELGDRSALIGAVYGVLQQQRSSVSYVE
ncbi:MAG TPA: ROK family transcriptional regulator [Bacillota bacterium]